MLIKKKSRHAGQRAKFSLKHLAALLGVGALVTGASVLGVATAASAHTPSVTADCSGLNVSLTNYAAEQPATPGTPDKTVTSYVKWVWTGSIQATAPAFDASSSNWNKTADTNPNSHDPLGSVYEQGNGANASWVYWQPVTTTVPGTPGTPAKVNHVTIVIDGSTVANTDFGSTYTYTSAAPDQTKPHTYKVTVTAWDDAKYDVNFSQTVNACQTTPPPVTPKVSVSGTATCVNGVRTIDWVADYTGNPGYGAYIYAGNATPTGAVLAYGSQKSTDNVFGTVVISSFNGMKGLPNVKGSRTIPFTETLPVGSTATSASVMLNGDTEDQALLPTAIGTVNFSGDCSVTPPSSTPVQGTPKITGMTAACNSSGAVIYTVSYDIPKGLYLTASFLTGSISGSGQFTVPTSAVSANKTLDFVVHVDQGYTYSGSQGFSTDASGWMNAGSPSCSTPPNNGGGNNGGSTPPSTGNNGGSNTSTQPTGTTTQQSTSGKTTSVVVPTAETGLTGQPPVNPLEEMLLIVGTLLIAGTAGGVAFYRRRQASTNK